MELTGLCICNHHLSSAIMYKKKQVQKIARKSRDWNANEYSRAVGMIIQQESLHTLHLHKGQGYHG